MLLLCALGFALAVEERKGDIGSSISKVCVFGEAAANQCNGYSVKVGFADLDGYLRQIDGAQEIMIVIFGSSATNNPRISASAMDNLGNVTIGEEANNQKSFKVWS